MQALLSLTLVVDLAEVSSGPDLTIVHTECYLTM